MIILIKHPKNKTKSKSNFSESLLKYIEQIPEIKECEYVYIDDINLQSIQSTFLQDKIIITQNASNGYLIFDVEDIEENGHINNITELESNHIVDLVILNKQVISNDLENFIDQDTIITKNLGNNIVYMEDKRNNITIFITEYEQFVIKGSGAKTQILYYKRFNT